MKIHEYQARELFEAYGIPTSRAEVVLTPEETEPNLKKLPGPTYMAKVQVLMGGRGKAGGVQAVRTAAEAKAFVDRFLGKPFSTYQSAGASKTVRAILLAETVAIASEYYLAVTLDRSHGKPVLLFSSAGGMDIETLAAKTPEKVLKLHFDPDRPPQAEALEKRIQTQIDSEALVRQIASIGEKLSRLFVEKDASLCEINPLVRDKKEKVLAIDAKITFDDNALFRHDALRILKDPEEEDEREKRAKKFGLSYVSMDGNVGCLVNGAGLAMATLDVIKLAGGDPANFLDIGGGATADQVKEGFQIILSDPRVKVIFVNIFGGISKCDDVANGIVKATKETDLNVPLIVRLEGTRVKEGREILKKSGLKIISCDSVKEAAEKAVEAAGR